MNAIVNPGDIRKAVTDSLASPSEDIARHVLAMAGANPDRIEKSITTGTGLVAYDLQAPAKNLYHWHCANAVAAAVYLQIFDTPAANVTLGTTPPKLSYPIPTSGYWEEHYAGEERPAFATAITVAVTTTPTGATAPATGAVCNFLYK